MGQKVHPIGLRLGIYRKWKSNWYFDSNNYTKFLHINLNIEKFFKGLLYYYPIKTLLMNCQVIKLPSNHLYVFVFFYRLRRKKKVTKRIDNIKKIKINLKNKKINKNYDNYKINSLLKNLNCFNLQKFKTIINLKSINQISKLTLIKKLQKIQFYIKLLNNLNKQDNFIKTKLFNKIKIEIQDLNIILKNFKKLIILNQQNLNNNIIKNNNLLNSNKYLYNLNYINKNILKSNLNKSLLINIINNILNKNHYILKDYIFRKKYNKLIIKNKKKTKQIKKYFYFKKNLYINIKKIKQLLSKLTNSKVNIIFINALSFAKFYYLISLNEKKKNNKKQNNLLLNIEKQIINRYKYNAIYVKDLVNIAFISILFKNMDFLTKFLGFQFKKTPKNKKQNTLIQLINQVVSLFAFKRKEVIGLKIKFKGRINRRKRAKSIIISKGILSLQTTETRVEYGYSEGYTRYGLIGIKLWIFYKKSFKKEFKNNLIKYFKYSNKNLYYL